jgi:hypothetical protein
VKEAREQPVERSSCWLHGCLLLAVVGSSVLVIILMMMVMARLRGHP